MPDIRLPRIGRTGKAELGYNLFLSSVASTRLLADDPKVEEPGAVSAMFSAAFGTLKETRDSMLAEGIAPKFTKFSGPKSERTNT